MVVSSMVKCNLWLCRLLVGMAIVSADPTSSSSTSRAFGQSAENKASPAETKNTESTPKAKPIFSQQEIDRLLEVSRVAGEKWERQKQAAAEGKFYIPSPADSPMDYERPVEPERSYFFFFLNLFVKGCLLVGIIYTLVRPWRQRRAANEAK